MQALGGEAVKGREGKRSGSFLKKRTKKLSFA
jgi:hypothetical protein